MLSTNEINWIGFWALYKKEVWRFIKVYHQTLIAPVITSMLFLAVFSLAMGKHVPHIENVPFILFTASGLIIMSVVQNAFANTSSTVVMGKVIGNYVDFLMPPFSPGEFTLAMTLGGVTRGFCVAVLVGIVLSFFVHFEIHNIFIVILYLFLASFMLALLGLLVGLLSNSFDQMAAFTNYIIIPLSFLSGTFYSVKDLPPILYTISHFNPFFYMIDGFRYGITGYLDGNLMIGMVVLIVTNIFIYILVYNCFRTGWRIKN